VILTNNMKKKNNYVFEALDKLRGVFNPEFDYPRAFNNNGSFINLIFILIYVVKNNLVKSLSKEFITTIDKSEEHYNDKLKNDNLDSLKNLNEYKAILSLFSEIEDQIHEKYPYKEQSIQDFYINVIIRELKYFSEGFINPAGIRVLYFLDFINRNRKNIDFRLLTEKILEFRFSNKYSSEFLTDTQIASVSPHLFDIEKLKKKKEKIVIYNPFSGLGSFGIAFIDILGLDNVKIINEEINSSTFNLSILRYLVLYDNIDNVSFINRNSLVNDFIPSDKMVGGYNPTTSGNITFGKVYDIDVLISDPSIGHKKSKSISMLFGKLIKKSKFSMICQYGSVLTKFNDDIPFENLNKVVQFESSASKGITSAHTFCFMFEKQKVNRDINMIFVDRDNLVTNKDLINKLHLYERKPELIISSSHEEFFKSFVGIKMMMPLDIQLIWYQKNIRNKYKYKRIEDISLPIDAKEIGFATKMGIYDANDIVDKKIEKLMQLPYANPASLFKNKLDFFTKKPNFSAPVTSDGVTVENALRQFKVIKCSCILMHRRGLGFSYFDINENPEGLVLNPAIAPIKLKNEFYLKYVITSMFLESFKDQIDILKDRNLIKETQINRLILEIDENKMDQWKIFNERRDEAIDNFLDYRAEITDIPKVPENIDSYDIVDDIEVIENIDIDDIDPDDLKKNFNSRTIKELKNQLLYYRKKRNLEKEKLIFQKKEKEERLAKKFKQEKEKYIKKLKENIGVYTHQLGNMIFKVSSDAEELGSLISKLKNDQNEYVIDIQKINNRLANNIDKIDEYIEKEEKSINEIFNYDKKYLEKIEYEEFSDIVKKCSEGQSVQIDNKLSLYSYMSSGALPFDDFLIISNHDYINDIFDNLIKNSIQHSKSKNIVIDSEIIMLKKEDFWKLIQKQSEKDYNNLIDKYSDLPYLKVEFKFDGNSIDKNITYKEYSEYGIKKGKEANKGIGGSIISGGIINSGGFFYYTNQNEMNVFNLYFPIEYTNAVDNDIKNDNIYELSEILWMIK